MAEITSLASGTTDSEGNVVLEYTENSKGTKNYYVELDGGEISDIVSVDIIGIDYLDMMASDTIIGDGQTSRITARAVLNGDPVPNLAIGIGTQTFKTDANGEAYIDYEGTGAGIVTVTGSCGGETESVTLEDVLLYYSKENNKAINFNYNAGNNLTVLLDTKGIYMVSSVNVFGLMYFGHISPLEYPKIIFEFDVLNFNTNVNGNNVSYNYGMLVCGVEISVTQAKLNERIKVEIADGYKKTYVGSTLIDSRAVTETTFFPQLQLERNCSVTIDNLKYTKGVAL